MKLIAYLVGLIIVAAISVATWQVGRLWNYNLSYKSMVQKTVIEMVKEECLSER